MCTCAKRDRVLDVADHGEGLDRAERVQHGGLGLGNDEHVAFVDPLPAADAVAVEPQAILEDVLVEFIDGDGEVLPEAGEVHEAEIDGLDILLAAESQYLFGSHVSLLSGTY